MADYLDLLLVKHAQPLQVNNIGYALSEGQAVRPDLLVQSVVGHQMDVGYSVCCGHGNVFSSWLQFNHLSQKDMILFKYDVFSIVLWSNIPVR